MAESMTTIETLATSVLVAREASRWTVALLTGRTATRCVSPSAVGFAYERRCLGAWASTTCHALAGRSIVDARRP